jgi:imidazoleglycerol phosphate synthase glutamine amidotransferase subunit HisH
MYVGIIDYGLGNIKSVKSAFEFLGYETILCREAQKQIEKWKNR